MGYEIYLTFFHKSSTSIKVANNKLYFIFLFLFSFHFYFIFVFLGLGFNVISWSQLSQTCHMTLSQSYSHNRI